MSDVLYTFYQTSGGNILFKYRKNGQSFTKKVDFYKPSLYVKANESETDTEVKSVYGYPLKQMQFDGIRDAKDFVKSYKDVEGFNIEGNSNYGNQFIIEMYQGKMPEFDAKKIRVGILDIEVDAPEFPEPAEAKWPINGVTFYDSFTDIYYAIGDVEYIHNKESEVGHLNVVYTTCPDELTIIRTMLIHFKEFQYDLTTGWNSESFDMPYIVNRCYKIVGEKFTNQCLSPFGQIYLTEITGNFGKSQIKANIVGLPHLDYMQLYKKHIYVPRESYRLDFIASEELGESKTSYEDEGSLFNLYRENPQKFAEYNVKDVYLIAKLDKKLGLLSLTYTLAYYTLSNYEDTLGTVKLWEQLVAKHLYATGRVPLFSNKNRETREFDGGFVKAPVPGFHEWVITEDLNSLYPHLEMQVNIGPETYIPRDQLPDELLALKSKYTIDDLITGKADLSVVKKYGLSMGANFEFYSKESMSLFSEIKRELYSMRKVYKKLMIKAQKDMEELKQQVASGVSSAKEELEAVESLNNNLQMGMKILLNAGYGALGNEHFLYFKVENAEAITTTGQLVNQWTCSRVNEYLKKLLGTDEEVWIYGDTDSGMFTLKAFHDKVLANVEDTNTKVDIINQFIETKIAPFIQKCTDELAEYLNSYENKMVWEREVIAESMVIVSKKRYAMKVWDQEGVRFKGKPKYKIMGLEAVKSSTPSWSRAYLKECYQIALDNDKDRLHAKVDEIRKEFFEKLSVHEIAIPRGVNNIDKYVDNVTVYAKGTPKNVKAAIIHNWLVDKKGLSIQKITDGNKIKYIDLKRPNPIGQDVIGFSWFLPQEFELDRYVDRHTVFDSSFLSPLQNFLDSIKWSHEPMVDLSDFFG